MSDLPAGRELDALIAEKVMGEAMPPGVPSFPSNTGNSMPMSYTVRDYMQGVRLMSPGGQWQAVCIYEHGDEPEWWPLNFSTDIAAAWLVVERMRQFTLVHCAGDPAYCGGPQWVVYAAKDGPFYADTAPLAICRAALKAVGA